MKNKIYLVGIIDRDPEFEELEISAKNKKEAKRKAQNIIDKQAEYSNMTIDYIQEFKYEK